MILLYHAQQRKLKWLAHFGCLKAAAGQVATAKEHKIGDDRLYSGNWNRKACCCALQNIASGIRPVKLMEWCNGR
jgi:hypothetical protein